MKLSLQRHREKICELTKELEQESLYVEYLERLLGEVERYRDSGSDAALVFDAATPTTKSSPNRISASEKNGPAAADNKDDDEVRRRNRSTSLEIYADFNELKLIEFIGHLRNFVLCDNSENVCPCWEMWRWIRQSAEVA